MNRQYLAWERFEQTGHINDYLAYCRTEERGDMPYADFHRWHRPENEASGK